VHNPDLTYGSMTDQEGNVYKTIVIGTQEWMAENLNTSSYRNGDAIVTDLDNAAWGATSSGAWSYYNNDASYECPYGKLYNWFACTDSRGLCPTGWHVPSDAEWTTLTNFLGGEGVAGGMMKSTGTIEATTGLWNNPNTGATNSSGFSGVSSGTKYYEGNYSDISNISIFWSNSEIQSDTGLTRYIYYAGQDVVLYPYVKQGGFSVRCLRD
jgi:uncharacterized protein (TIGR02145 family)